MIHPVRRSTLALCAWCAWHVIGLAGAAEPESGASASALAPQALRRAVSGFDAHGARMGHPRLFKGQKDYAGIVAATRAERARGMAALVDYLKRHPVRAEPAQLKAQIASSDKNARMASWWQQSRVLEGASEAAFAWYVQREDWLLHEVKARLSLFGPQILKRGCRGDVTEIREYAWQFALAYDFAHAGLDPAERQMVNDVVVQCAEAGLADTPAAVSGQVDNGMAFNALGKLVGALLIVRGDMPNTHGLLARALPAYVAGLSPWGGKDGGFANGSSYALWDAGEAVLVWDLLERVLGVPIYRKPWLASLPRYVAYTLPPGTPAGAFGDGAEVERSEEWARLGKAVATRSNTPLARWYARAQTGEDPARLHVLLSPRAHRGAVGVKDQPRGASFPSVGVAAMHSSLLDRKRVSVLFKSSPYGSLNHSHADQNSFVVYAGGKVMAMDSGVYDSYNSAHWRGWYKQTRAHNAITYDGGQGQQLGKLDLGSRAHNGRLAKFSTTASYDVAIGDATAAYGGDVRMAKRALVFIRPATLVVVDRLASREQHGWEWNLHTLTPLIGAADSFKVEVEGQGMCGTLRASDNLSLSSTTGYTPPPATKAGPHHWHRFALAQPAREAVFVSVLRMQCDSPAPEISVRADGARVRVAGRTVLVKGENVTVSK